MGEKGRYQKTVIVLGMHRSGTSMIAGVLHRLGVDMGKSMIGPMPSNPRGHFEDKGFVALNDRILKAAGGSWCNPPTGEAIRWQFNNFRGEIKTITDKLNGQFSGWKDPRTSLTIELYLPFLKSPCLIVIQREAAAVARSLQKRNNFSLEKGLSLNELYQKRITNFTESHPGLPVLKLSYEEVVASPRPGVKKIIEFLSICPPQIKIEHAVSLIIPGTGSGV